MHVDIRVWVSTSVVVDIKFNVCVCVQCASWGINSGLGAIIIEGFQHLFWYYKHEPPFNAHLVIKVFQGCALRCHSGCESGGMHTLSVDG